MRAEAPYRGLPVLEGEGGFARPAAGRHGGAGRREERIQCDEIGVVGGDGDRRIVGILRQESAFPGERLRDGDPDAMARDREGVHGEAGVGALRVGGEAPFGTAALGERLRELAQVRPQRLEVDVGLPAGAIEFAFGAARDADVRQLLTEDAEARRVDVEFGDDRGATGEMFAAELHRRAPGGVAHGAGESDAGFSGRRGGVQHETDGAGGGGAGVLGRDFHAQRSEVIEQRVQRDAFTAERTAEGGLQGNFPTRVGGQLADGEAGPGDAGAQVSLAAGVEGVSAHAEAQQRAVRQLDAPRGGVWAEDERRQSRLGRRRRGRILWRADRSARAEVDVERLEFEAAERVGTAEDGEELGFAFERGRGDLGAVGEDEVDTLGGEFSVEGRFDAGDAALDAGVGEESFDADAEGFGSELGFDPEKSGSDGDGDEADAPEGDAENTGHGRRTLILPGRPERATKSPVESLPPG